MAKRAEDGIEDLLNATVPFGGADLVGSVVVDQVYAEIQHEALEFRHPRGGQAKYLTTPLLATRAERLTNFANALLGAAEAGESIAFVWDEHVVEPLAADVETYAPVLENDLRQSASRTVTDVLPLVDVPAIQPRLPDEEARAKGSRRELT